MFAPEDEDGATEARAFLLNRFDSWLRSERGLADPDTEMAVVDARIALDWKWRSSDGHLTRWTVDDYEELLLDWCPEKLSVSPANAASIPPSLAAFAEFMGAEGHLALGSSPAAWLAAAALAATDEFTDIMGDTTRFGTAKSIFAAALNDGVDVDDPNEIQRWVSEFNERPFDERDQLLGPPLERRATRPLLPVVVPPTAADLDASRAGAPILKMFAELAAFIGAGRKLTQKGNLTLADARVLVDRLSTGDEVDERIGDRTFRTTSSGELYRLTHVFRWAKKAGVVRVQHGKVIATKAGLAISDRPGHFFERSADALLQLGPLSSQRMPRHWSAWPDVDELLDQSIVHLLAGPYILRAPVPISELASMAGAAVLDAFRFPNSDDADIQRRISYDVTDIIDALELAGLVRRADLEPPDPRELYRSRRRGGGTVELTPAGVVVARELLLDAGYDAPVAGAFADVSAAQLLIGTDASSLDVFEAELDTWLRRRTPAEAARQLTDAADELDDPALCNLALSALSRLDPEVVEPEVRRLTATSRSRGFARCWLVDHTGEPPSTLLRRDDLEGFVDTLAHRLVAKGPDGLADTLALAGSHEQQVALIGDIWRSESAATESVLAALGATHPSRPVAKAARKAIMQRRSWLANGGG